MPSMNLLVASSLRVSCDKSNQQTGGLFYATNQYAESELGLDICAIDDIVCENELVTGIEWGM